MYEQNYLAILVSAIVYFILGGVWYAAIFSKQYQAALNFSEEEEKQAKKDFPKALGAHFISGLITSFVLASIIHGLSANDSFTAGMLCGAICWFGFVFTVFFNAKMFDRLPMAMFLINLGFYLVAFAIMGGILAVWQ